MIAASTTAVLGAPPVRLRGVASRQPRGLRRTPVCAAATSGYFNPLRPGESVQEAAARRERETARIRQRTTRIKTLDDLQKAFSANPENLFILAIESLDECFLGENPEGWAELDNDKTSRMQACDALADALHRIARDSDNVTFLSFIGDEDASAKALTTELGAVNFPTVQYWRNGDLLWQTVGAQVAGNSLGDNLLFFGSRDSSGASTAGLIEEISNENELQAFFEACSAPQQAIRGITISAPCEKQIAVLDVALAKNSPGCIHIFPAVVALAKTTAGAVRWGRLLGDSSPVAAELMKKLKVENVPSFVFFVDGKEVGRYSGSDRGQLMTAVLDIQSKVGFKLPEPPVRKRLGTAEAKRIAAERREREKSNQKMGWTS